MSTDNGVNNKISENAGTWIGWIGLVISVIGFFWLRIWLGAVGVIMGIVGLFSPKKTLNIVTIIAGVIAIVLGLVL